MATDQLGRISTLTQPELESRLWAAANSLRGPVDPADFKAYIFPLLFFKRISDTWDAEHARALADFGGDEDLAALPENYRFRRTGAPTSGRAIPGAGRPAACHRRASATTHRCSTWSPR